AEELETFFTKERPEGWKWLLGALALFTGARMDELCERKVTDVDAHCLTIPDSKTVAGLRKVPLHPIIQPLVEKLKANSTDGYLVSGIEFTDAINDNKRVRGLSSAFSKARDKLGLPKVVNFHCFRNSFINELEKAGVPESTIRLIAGHAREGVTLGTYSR